MLAFYLPLYILFAFIGFFLLFHFWLLLLTAAQLASHLSDFLTISSYFHTNTYSSVLLILISARLPDVILLELVEKVNDLPKKNSIMRKFIFALS